MKFLCQFNVAGLLFMKYSLNLEGTYTHLRRDSVYIVIYAPNFNIHCLSPIEQSVEAANCNRALSTQMHCT